VTGGRGTIGGKAYKNYRREKCLTKSGGVSDEDEKREGCVKGED